jgi:hypothetical protein
MHKTFSSDNMNDKITPARLVCMGGTKTDVT